MPLRLTIASLIALALLVAGCGGAMTKGEYEKEVKSIGRKVDKAVNAQLGSKSPQSGDDMRKAADALGEAADDMEGLEPPKEVAKPHDQMVDGLRAMEKAFNRLADDLDDAKDDEARMKLFYKMFEDKDAAKGLDLLTKAQEGFVRKGYTVFANASGSPSGGGDSGATDAGAGSEADAKK